MITVRMTSVLLVLATALLQAALLWRIDVLQVTPNLLICVVASVALITGPINGAISGFAGGAGLALFGAIPLGPHALIATLVGYGIGRVGEQLITDEHPVPPVLATVFACAAMAAGRPLVEFLVNPDAAGVDGVLRSVFISTALGAIMAIPVYVGVRRLLAGVARISIVEGEVVA